MVIGWVRKGVLMGHYFRFQAAGGGFVLSESPDYLFRFSSRYSWLSFYLVVCVGVLLPSDMCCPAEILSALEAKFTYL